MDLSSLSSELTAQALSFLGRVLTVATLLMSINSDPLLSENVDSSSCILCEVEKPLLFSEPRPDDLFGQAVALAKRPKPLHWKHSFSAARQSPSWWERSQFFHLDLHLGPWPDLLEFLRTLSLPFFPQKVSSSAPAQLLMYATFWLFAVIVRNAILDFASFYQSPHYCISSSCPFQGGMVPVDPLLLPLQPQAVLLWLLQLLLHLHELLPASLAVIPCTVVTGLGSSQAPGL